ncbi:hypothetical protein [Actinophytocola sp.]|uniref:hypothetical protein n=1 Tax=Actinophytocola sp. TaxID=1872138 RepID=UPI003D6C2785
MWQGVLVGVLLGVVGALGGLFYKWITGQEMTFEIDIPSLGFTALGGIVLLAVLRLLQGAGNRR